MPNPRFPVTSLLVAMWNMGGAHTSRCSARYYDMLDLGEASGMMLACKKIWSHYGEVIRNRKHCVLDMAGRILADHATTQVVILGGGVDALPLEITSRFDGVTVYETDMANMNLKRSLMERACPESADRIKCITVDLAHAGETVRAVSAAGWDRNRPSLLILEGVSYYISSSHLWSLISAFGEGGNGVRNNIILEYMLPPELIDPSRRDIADRVFGIIAGSEDIEFTRHESGTIRARAGAAGGYVVERHTLHSMERDRTGRNTYFPTNESGWIEVCRIVQGKETRQTSGPAAE